MTTTFVLQRLADGTSDPDQDKHLLDDPVVIALASLLDEDALTIAGVERALTREALRLLVES